jgi:hypothetical protein
MTTKDRLHQLGDELLEGEAVVAAVQVLEQLRVYWQHPLARKLLSAPIDNESQTEEECAGVEEAHQDLAAGRLVSREEIRREFGRLHSGLFVPWSAWQRQGTVM